MGYFNSFIVSLLSHCINTVNMICMKYFGHKNLDISWKFSGCRIWYLQMNAKVRILRAVLKSQSANNLITIMILQGIFAAIKAIPKYVHLAKIFPPKNTDYYSFVLMHLRPKCLRIVKKKLLIYYFCYCVLMFSKMLIDS